MITKNGTWVVFLCSCIFRNALIRYLNIEKTSLNVRPKLYEMALGHNRGLGHKMEKHREVKES